MKENEITGTIVDAAFEVHRELAGPGLLEDVPMFPSESLRLRASAPLRLCVEFRANWKTSQMKENEITGVIVDAAFEVHRELGGPGLLEDVPMFPSESLRLRVSASLR